MNLTNQSKKTVFIRLDILNIVLTVLYFTGTQLISNPKHASADSTTAIENTINPCKEYGISAIKKHAYLPDNYKVLSMQPVDNLCEIAIEAENKYITIYTYKDYVMVGDLFMDQKAVTKDLVDKIEGRVLEENREQLDECTAITYEPKDRNLHRTLYMVVTPGCHFCEESSDQIPLLSERYGLTIKVIIYSENNKKAIGAICRDMSIDEYNSEEFEKEIAKDEYQCERGQEILKKSKKLVDKIGITGFPTFIFDTGKQFVGGNMPKLERTIVLYLESIERELAAR